MNFDMLHLLPVFNCLCHMGRIFKRPLFMARSYIAEPRKLSIPFVVDEKPILDRATRPESGQDARELGWRGAVVRTTGLRLPLGHRDYDPLLPETFSYVGENHFV